MRDVPPAIWYCLTLAFLGVTTAFVALSVAGADASEFRSFLNTVLNFAALIVSGGGAIFAGAAAKSAASAERQTNGVLDAKIQAAIAAAVQTNGDPDTAVTVYREKMREGDNGRPAV